MIPNDELPELPVSALEDEEILEATTATAVEFFVSQDPNLVRVVEELLLQHEILANLVPEAGPQIEIVRHLGLRLGEMLTVRVARWAATARRSS